MIFVTGGTGLVGRHLLLEFRARGWPTMALVRDEGSADAVRKLGAVPLLGAAEAAGTWARLEGCRAIVHAAALVTAHAAWETYQRVNVGSVRLAAARARQLGIPLVHVSSVAVYGREGYDAPGGSVDEGFPFGPLGDAGFYARSKRLAEQALWETGGELRAAALRPCVIYGEGDRQFLPRVLRLARRGWLPLVGPGNLPLTLVHARNIALAAAQLIELDRGWGRAFNVVNDDAITAKEFIAAVGEGLGRPIRAVRIPATAALLAARLGDLVLGLATPGRYPTRLHGALRFWRGGNPYNTDAARRILDWVPAIRHREGVPLAVRSLATTGR